MYNVIFLGDRLIAANALKRFVDPRFVDKFDIKVIVSSDDFIHNAGKQLKVNPEVVISNSKRNSAEIEDAIKKTGVNLLISVQHNWILSKKILSLVDLAFNLHNAKLPDYKGYSSISHAIHNRDKDFFSTIHWMAEEVDTGDIAYEYKTPIEKDEDAYTLYLKTVNSSQLIFNDLLNDLAKNVTPPKSRIDAGGVFYGKNLLSTTKDVTDIMDEIELDFRVRSAFFSPHEPAYMTRNGNKFHLIPEKWKRVCWEQIQPGYTIQWDKI